MNVIPTMYGLVGWKNRKPIIYGKEDYIDLSNVESNVLVYVHTNSGIANVKTSDGYFTTTSSSPVTVTGYGIESYDNNFVHLDQLISEILEFSNEFPFGPRDLLCRFAEDLSTNPCFL